MSQLGEIRLFAFGFAPKNWLPCNGERMTIGSNAALFVILGTKFGGNGTTYFNLPDLRGKVLLGQGNGYAIGNSGGEEMHALTVAEIAAHSHGVMASENKANATTPTNNFWPANGGYQKTSDIQLSPVALTQTGNNAGHPNMAPFLSLNYCILVVIDDDDDDFGENYVGMIQTSASSKISDSWAPCDGREFLISALPALFSIIGNKYGGDGNTTFKLPNLQGGAAVNWGQAAPGLSTYQIGDTGGAASVTLTQGQLPQHNHTPAAATAGGFQNAANTAVWANSPGRPAPPQFATAQGKGILMSPSAIANTGGGGGHNNLMPYTVANYFIKISGNTPPKQ